MAIWAIPNDKIIDYSRTGDDIDLFSQKVKYCLEEAFVSLNELHEGLGSLSKATNEQIAGISATIDGLEDGQILIYDGSTNGFLNVNLQALLNSVNQAGEVRHLKRLVENLYLTLAVAGLDPGGYDGLAPNVFFSEFTDIDDTRSTFAIVDGKIFSPATLIMYPQFFVNDATGEVKSASHAHLIVKHQNVFTANITAELALYDALDAETFAPMTKTGTYPDRNNPDRATTEFIYSGAAGNVATLKLTLDSGGGESFWIDSFACTFDE